MLGFWYWLIGRNDWTYQIRNTKCKECSFNKKYTCGECGCFKQLKLRLDNEKCPLGKW